MRHSCISWVYFCAEFLKYTIMINYSDYYSEYFFDCFQNSDLTNLSFSISYTYNS